MRHSLLVVGFLGLLGVFAACGGSDHAAAIDPGTETHPGMTSRSGTTSTSNSSDAGGANEGGGGSAQAANAPVVQITSPEGSSTPDEGVLSQESIQVVCTALQSTSSDTALDPTSVTISLKDADGNEIDHKSASPTKNDDEYAAEFVLTTVPAGAVSLTCSAKDKDGVQGSDTISSFIDHGPSITVVTPEPDAAYPLKGGLAIEFEVDPAPLAKNDDGADVDSVTFSLDGKDVPVDEVSPGKYQTNLAIDDTDLFPVAPTGAILITATNSRTPEPVKASLAYNIVVDGVGPVINITAPAPQKVVGGKVTLVFTATDAGSGVDEASVNVALFPKDEPRFFDPNKGWSRKGDEFRFTFDTKLIEPDAPVQTTINVLASDKAGNPSSGGQSVQLYLDNVAPQIDLDPRDVRMISAGACSGAFDPVGDSAVNDLDGTMGKAIVNPIAFFRVFVLERTNSQPGQQLFFYSGTDQTQVRLYIQPSPDTATPKLLINKNPGVDDTCDDIGGIDDVANAPPFTAMHSINATSAQGTIYNKIDADVDPMVPANFCTLKDGGPNPPTRLCPSHNSDLWYVPFNTRIKEPLVYVVGTPNSGDDSCAGVDFAFLSANQPDGWVCAAARAVDHAGNVGISPPLRFCVVRDPQNPPACAISSTTPPTCTDGCTPPARGGGFFLQP